MSFMYVLFGYCVLSLYDSHIITETTYDFYHTPDHEHYSSSVSSSPLFHNEQVEIFVNTHGSGLTHVVKKKTQEFSLFLILTEGLLTHIFSQYTSYVSTLLVGLNTTDIIFPFHYFW